MSALDSKLCYIKNNCAYFTSASPSEERGDDWDDCYYATQAGEPYPKEGVTITKAYYDHPECGGLQTPEEINYQCPYTVDQINAGAVAWLYGNGVSIGAGTTLRDFLRLVGQAGGFTYVEPELAALILKGEIE